MAAICVVRNRAANAVMLAWLIMFYVVRLTFLS